MAATTLTAIFFLLFFIVINRLVYADSCRITLRHSDEDSPVRIRISLHFDPDDL